MLQRVIQVGTDTKTPTEVEALLDGLTPKPTLTQGNKEWLRRLHDDPATRTFGTIDVLAGELKGTAAPSVGTPTGTLTTLDPNAIKFSQSTANNETSDKITLDDLAESLRKDGWKPGADPLDVIDVPGMGTVSVDNRRIVAARRGGLTAVPVRMHHFNDPCDMEPGRLAAGFKLNATVDLVGGVLVPKPKKKTATAETVFLKGKIAETWGEAVLFRTINQGKKFPIYGQLALPTIK